VRKKPALAPTRTSRLSGAKTPIDGARALANDSCRLAHSPKGSGWIAQSNALGIHSPIDGTLKACGCSTETIKRKPSSGGTSGSSHEPPFNLPSANGSLYRVWTVELSIFGTAIEKLSRRNCLPIIWLRRPSKIH
jgi:hypothetical protein